MMLVVALGSSVYVVETPEHGSAPERDRER
jgi:hypothetical protein